jgi:hypothetical protein
LQNFTQRVHYPVRGQRLDLGLSSATGAQATE